MKRSTVIFSGGCEVDCLEDAAGKKIVDTSNTIPALRSTHSAFDGFQGKHLHHSSPSPERLMINTKHISNLNAFSLPESKCCPEH